MEHYKKVFFVPAIVALASRISIGVMDSDFRVSAGIIFLAIFLFYYEDLKPIPTGILSGIMVNLLRLIGYYFKSGNFNDVIVSYPVEILFYTFYAIIYSLLIGKSNKSNINFVFFVIFISDFGANLIEILVRTGINSPPFPWGISSTLLFVAIIRSSIVWIVLNLLKHYRMLLMREEHEARYKRLLWLTSQLKTEMYWLEKNMDNIEKVMAESYRLFEIINLNEDKDSWANKALTIAKDIHEIKKENELAIRGIIEITENELKDKGMNFKDITNILFETMKKEIKRTNKNIELKFHIEENFYTLKHYYLMSMLRNLIINSIEAIPDFQEKAMITFNHKTDDVQHIFIVSDNGEGIDKEGLERIFSSGFSTKINYNTGEINRGLGLAIVQYIVEEQLEGRIDVSSSEGKGTNFYIYVPRKSLEVVQE